MPSIASIARLDGQLERRADSRDLVAASGGEEVRHGAEQRERHVGARRELVAELRQGVERRARLRFVERARGQHRALGAHDDLDAPTPQALARHLLGEHRQIDELAREPRAHVEEALVHRADLGDDTPIGERSVTEPEAGHAPHEPPRST